MAEALIKLPFDKTGAASTNKVLSESHELVNRQIRTVVPEYGAFFEKSLVIRDGATLLPLVPGTQYQMAELYPVLTRKYGKAIWAAIIITDKTVSNTVIIDYQALGGEYSYSQPAIRAKYAEVANSSNPLDYKDLIDVPVAFPVAPHKTDGEDLYGLEYFTKVMARIKESVAIGDRGSHNDVYNFIAQVIGDAGDDASVVVDQALADHLNALNPHPQYAKQSDIGSSIAGVRKPVNIEPASASTNVLPTVTLSASPYYTYYGILQKSAQFQASADASFATPEFDVTIAGSVTSYKPQSIFHPSSTYYWRVRYQDSEGLWSAWSETTTFSTSAVSVGVPSITSPISGADTQTESPAFASSEFVVIGGTDTHASSDWELWTGPNGTGVKAFSITDDPTNKTSMSVPLATLAQNTHYFARVRYKGASYGYSNWSQDLLINSVWPLRPTVIGESFGSGYWAGDIVIGSSTYAIIVAPKASGETTAQLYNSTVSTANMSMIDSVANTSALASAGAPKWARELRIGGFNDWQVPAANVMTLIWENLRASKATAPTNFKTGGADMFENAYYWSSTGYNWQDSETDAPTPNYGNVNHVDCSYSKSAWYGPSDGTGPAASCPRGTVSNYRVGYFAGINPQGQWASLNTATWCCSWIAYEVISYTPGRTYYYNYYDAFMQHMGAGNSRPSSPKTISRKVRAVRLVKVA